MAVLDAGGRVLHLNPAGEALLGVCLSELQGARWPALFRFVDRAGRRLRLRELPPAVALRHRRAVHGAIVGVARTGRLLWLQVDAAPLRDGTGTLLGAVVSFVDIATAEIAADGIAAHDDAGSDSDSWHYRELVENASDIVFTLDLSGRIVTVNDAGLAATGYDRAELLGRGLHEIAAPEETAFVTECTRRLTDGERAAAFDATIVRRDGSRLLLEVRAWALAEHGRPVAIQGIARDVSERRTLERRLRHAAFHDALTGLPNRMLLYDRLQQALNAAERNRESLALLFLDLDRFKAVNDALGHLAGDQLLKQIAGRLLGTLRESDTVARLGGDEFAVLLPATGAAGARVATAKLLRAFTQPFLIDGRIATIGASAGIALFPQHGDSVEALLRCADLAMYVAKRAGGGVSIYEPSTTAVGA